MNPSPAIKAPDALIIVLAVLVLAIGLTWLVPGTYQRVAAAPVAWHAVFTAPVRGFTDPDAALIIAFIL